LGSGVKSLRASHFLGKMMMENLHRLSDRHDFRLKRYKLPMRDAALPQFYRDRNPIKINYVNISTFHLLYFNASSLTLTDKIK